MKHDRWAWCDSNVHCNGVGSFSLTPTCMSECFSAGICNKQDRLAWCDSNVMLWEVSSLTSMSECFSGGICN